MKIRYLFSLLFIILCLSSCRNKVESAGEAVPEEPAEQEMAEPAEQEMAEPTEQEPAEEEESASETVTFMVYMTGSDLESSAAAATNDMAEIAQSGVDLRYANVLVYTGGAQTWHCDNPEIPSDANVLYQLTENGYEEVERMELLSMGDPVNLERFLSYCFEHYPADSYDLVLWDHGNGPVIGYGSDKQFEGDSLTLPEMREALEQSPFGGENKLSLIGFDACLMSSVELMCICAPYAEYMVASQEVEPSFGWNYGFLSLLGKEPAEEVAAEIVEAYSTYSSAFFAEKEFFQSDVTLAAVNLSYAAELEEALNALFLEASDDVSGDYNKLAAARVRSHGFGRASTGSEYDLVDLENLMEQMQERYPKQTAEVREILSLSVPVSDSTVPDSCGLSLFYPYYNKNYYRKTWKSAYAELGVLKEYGTFLSRYEEIWLGTDLKELFNDTLQLREGKEHDTFTMQLTPEQAEQFASARFYILQRKGDKSYTRLYSSNAVTEKKGVLTAQFEGRVIYIHDNYGRKLIPVTKMWGGNGNVTEYTCRAVAFEGLMLTDTLRCEMQFAADQESGEVVVKGIFATEESESLTTGKRELVSPEDWTGLMFYEDEGRYLKRDEEGHIVPYEEWPEAQWLSAHQLPFANGISFSFEPLYDDGEEYFIMFEVADLQDNRYSSELLPITLTEAPIEEKEEKTPTEAVWRDKDCAVLFEEHGVTLELCFAEDQHTGAQMWQTRLRNDNDFEVEVYLEDVLINDKISLGSREIYLSAKGNSEELKKFPEMMGRSLALSGSEKMEQLFCVAYMDRPDTMGYLLFEEPLIVYFSEAEEQTNNGSIGMPNGYIPSLIFEPALGLHVKEQVLMEDDRMKVTVLGAGYIPDHTFDVHFAFCVENKSEEAVPFDVNGFKVGGIFLQGRNYASVQGPIPPGKRIYADVSVPDYQIEQAGITEAHSLEVLLRTKEEENTSGITQDGGTWYPVILEGAAEEGPEEEAGKLLYEDDYVQILLSDSRIEMNSAGTWGSQIRDFTVINKTDMDLEVRGTDYLVNGEKPGPEDYGYYFSCKVGANSKTVHRVDKYIYEYAPLPSLAFRVQVLSLGAGTLYHESEEYLMVPETASR